MDAVEGKRRSSLVWVNSQTDFNVIYNQENNESEYDKKAFILTNNCYEVGK